MSSTAKPSKLPSPREAIYLDATDDVAAVIEAIKAAKGKSVALVLPKRTDVFRSIVNLKLIKRVGDQIPKTIILVTTDSTTIGLAAQLKLLVSPNLQTEPKLEPMASATDFDPTPSMTPIEIDSPVVVKPRRPRRPERRPGRRFRSRSRSQFQRWAWFWLASGLLVALLVVGFLALPETRATVTIQTRTESVSAQLQADLSVDWTEPDLEISPARLPLTTEDFQSKLTAKVTATGQRSIGNYASGDITIINCRSTRLVIPNQTVVARNGLSFVTLESLSLGSSNSNCDVFPGTSGTVRVRASQFGANYNLAPGSYQIDSLGDDSYRANAGRMTGGSQRLVTVINQSDIDLAAAEVEAQRDDRALATEFQQQLLDRGLQPLATTFQANPQKLKSTVEIGDELSTGQVTLVIDYEIGAVARPALDQLAQAVLAPQAGDLVVVDNGLDSANYRLVSPSGSSNRADYRLEVDIFEARIGLGLDQAALLARVQGQSRKAAAADLRQLPGVTQADVSISPFWQSTIPTDPERVTIIIQGQVESDRQIQPEDAGDGVGRGN